MTGVGRGDDRPDRTVRLPVVVDRIIPGGPDAVPGDAGREPVHVGCVLWGDAFRTLFLDLCLASLLAPGNLPELAARPGSRLVIATTAPDWAALARSPLFEQTASLVEPTFLELPPEAPGTGKYRRVSDGHRLIAEHAAAEGASAVFICPDEMVGRGTIRALLAVATGPVRAVVASALRFTEEGIRGALAGRGWHAGEVIDLPPRRLVALSLAHMHEETLRYDWTSPWYAHQPHCTWWAVPEEAGILLHGMNWVPRLVRYGRLTRHDAEPLRRWTLDGDYAYRNFGIGPEVAVIADSDVLAWMSVTPVSDRASRRVRNRLRLSSLRVVSHGPMADPLRRHLYTIPVRYHAGEPDAAAWERAVATARPVLQAGLAPPSALEARCVAIAADGLAGLPRHAAQWLGRRLRRGNGDPS